MVVGYVRVSSTEQNMSRQEVLMQQLGVEKIFSDKVSGKDTEREQLKEMLTFVREGDTIVVSEISRLARNTRDLLNIISQLKEKGVGFKSIKEGIDTNNEMGQFMLTIFGAVAELEREYILSRQREGIEIAKKQGKYKGRQRIKVEGFEETYKLWREKKINAKQAMKLLNLKPNTFYRRVQEYEEKNFKKTFGISATLLANLYYN